MTFLTHHRIYLLLPMLAFGLVMGGCNTDDDDPDDIDPTKQWELLGEASIGSHPSNGGIYANNGNVYLGYLDYIQNVAVVKRYIAATDSWEDYGSGLAGLYAGVSTDDFVNTSFAFRQDGATSYVFFNRSITDSELIVFRCSGGVWEQLPSVPLNQLYGGYWGVIQNGMDVEVKNGNVYVAVRWDSDPETYLCVFIYSGGGWSLKPERVSYASIPNTFSYEGYFDPPSIRVSDNGAIYLAAYGFEEASNMNSARVYKSTGAGWTDLIAPNTIEAISASDKMHFYVNSTGGQDQVLIVPYQNDNDLHAHLYSGSSWSELVSTEMTHSFVFTDCGDCLARRASIYGEGSQIQLWQNGNWTPLGANFGIIGSVNMYAVNDLAYDASSRTLYFAYTGANYEVKASRYVLD